MFLRSCYKEPVYLAASSWKVSCMLSFLPFNLVSCSSSCCSISSPELAIHPRGLIPELFGHTWILIIDSTRNRPTINNLHYWTRKPQKPHLFHPETYSRSGQATHQRLPKMNLNVLPPRITYLWGQRLRHRLHHHSGVPQGSLKSRIYLIPQPRTPSVQTVVNTMARERIPYGLRQWQQCPGLQNHLYPLEILLLCHPLHSLLIHHHGLTRGNHPPCFPEIRRLR